MPFNFKLFYCILRLIQGRAQNNGGTMQASYLMTFIICFFQKKLVNAAGLLRIFPEKSEAG